MWLVLIVAALPVAIGLLTLRLRFRSNQPDEQPPHMGF
jgi:hypothetical protein